MGNRRGVLLVVLLVAAGIGVWRWRGCHRDEPATSTVTQPAAKTAVTPAARAKQPARIAVTVTGAKGPLANAIVRLAPEGGDVLAIRTGADGVARAELEPGTWQISASAPDHEPAALPAHELSPGDDAKLALVLAAGGRTLAGLVTDVSGGPIAGARIDAARLQMARPERAVATTLTGGDGRYQLTVAEGQLLVAARSPDYAAQSRYVEVGASGATADFALVPGGVIEGVVLDAKTRRPVAGAAVDASRDRAAIRLAETGGHRVVAGPEGKFRIAGLRPGVYELDATAEGLHAKAPTIVGLGVAEQISDVEILVGAGPVIRGQVIDETDAPVANASVDAIGEGRQPGTRSDARGAFVLEGLSPGDHFVFAHSDAFVVAGGTPVKLADKDVDNVVVRVKRGIKIKGHVEPRQIADVRLEPDDRELGGMAPSFLAPMTTQADGEFELSPAAPGKARLVARCPSGDQGSLELELEDGMPELVLKVAPGASIAGRVVDGEGKPVPGVTVMAASQGRTETATIVNGMVTSGVQALTTLDGKYEVKGLAPGKYRMTALERGRPLRMRGKQPQVTLAELEHETGVELAVDRSNGVIKGVVTGPDGKPLGDAWVSVHQDLGSMIDDMMGGHGGDGPPGPEGESRMVRVESRDGDDGGGGDAPSDLPPALTDAQGRYELRGLPHAELEVVAEAQAGKLRGRAAKVTPDATVNLQAVGVTTLSGTVRGVTGPAALFTLELEGSTRAQRTFTDGVFEMGRVDPGAYTVRVRSSDGNAEQQVEVVAGKPTTVDIMLIANAIVVGTVVDGAGKPVANIPVVVIDDDGGPGVRVSISGQPPTSGPDGRFRIEHKAGPATVVVMTPPRPVTKRGLTLAAGKTIDVGPIRVETGAPAPP